MLYLRSLIRLCCSVLTDIDRFVIFPAVKIKSCGVGSSGNMEWGESTPSLDDSVTWAVL